MTETANIYGPIVGDLPLVGDRLRALGAGHHPLLADALTYVFETHGKRLRPALVLLSGKLGRYDLDRLVTLAASLEVVHTATLVHDDTIDGALTRRGLRTLSSVWDGKVAILVGDYLFAQSAELATELEDVRVMRLLSETVMAMSSGELRQYASTQAREIDEADYFQRIAGKTASLIATCCRGAAIVSGQTSEQVDALASYGVNLGLAFQIADDVLDYTGDEQTLGKPAGNDLREGTITLPLILMAQDLPSADPLRQDIEVGRNLDNVIEAVRGSGAAERALQRADEYAEAARSSLAVFPPSEARDSLYSLTEYVITRLR
jgi:geranylgeranyl pyrophosphate synthase